MAAPIPSTARSPFPPGRWIQRRGRTSRTRRRCCELGPHPQWSEAGKIVSLDPWGHRVAKDFRRPYRRRHRYKADDRDHQSAADAARDPARNRRRAPRGRRRDRPRGGRHLGHQDRDRPGLVAARRRRTVRGGGGRPQALPLRADRRHVSRARHPARSVGVPAADRRDDALHLRRSGPARRRDQHGSPAASTTNATDRTCSAPTSAPVDPT